MQNNGARETAAVILNSIERYKRNQAIYFQNVNENAVSGFAHHKGNIPITVHYLPL